MSIRFALNMPIVFALCFSGERGVKAQIVPTHHGFADNVIVPQSRAFAWNRPTSVQITEVNIGVHIVEQVATTVMDINLRNMGSSRTEGELIVPVPEGVAVRGFSFEGHASEPTAEVLTKEDAKQLYESIVAKSRDPALLEFVGCNLIRSSVFPVEGNGTQKIRLTYEHLLTADGNRIDYVLPRSESLQYSIPWKATVNIRSKRPISTVYSPSHAIDTMRVSPNHLTIKLADVSTRAAGAFRMSYLLEGDGVTASLLAFPDVKMGGGYFLLLAGLPADPSSGKTSKSIRREVTLVIDRSGSMGGEKIEQARAAALQVLNGLENGEAFNLITYSDSVEVYSREPILKTRESVKTASQFINSIQSAGGTNIHAAISETMQLKTAPGMLPIVLFLTDGLPTVGNTSEAAIRDVAIKSNAHERRVFTFGVGVDVNTPLLEKIASENRGAATFVMPKEDVEVKVAQVFKRLQGPVLSDPKLEVVNASGSSAPGRVLDLLPAKLPDLFAGDQLVLLGRYNGTEPLNFELRGNYLGIARDFRFHFELAKGMTRNTFIPRLWASRKIGMLVDEIRQLGADKPAMTAAAAASDPRLKELVDEIVRLSTEFGVLTEYTAFLAHEGTDLSKRADVLAQATGNFKSRAIDSRCGVGSVNQEGNQMLMKSQAYLNSDNRFYDQRMNCIAISNVQQVNDRAFYRRDNRWIDGELLGKEGVAKPKREIEFGSAEFHELIQRLAAQNRQGCVSLQGDVLLMVDGESVLVKGPKTQ